MSGPQRLEEAQDRLEVEAEVIQGLGAGRRLDAFAKPFFKLFIDELAAFGISDLGVEHLDEGFELFELLVVSVDAFLPTYLPKREAI